ncbi:DNA-3-methyladenine glycosylase family protein [Agromyces sp. NPDC055520]
MITNLPADSAAYADLMSSDPVFETLVRRVGTPNPFEFPDGGRTANNPFAGMALHVLAQQISVSVALVLYDRLTAAIGGTPTAERLLLLDVDQMRDLGTSRAKASYLRELAWQVHTGALDFERVNEMPDAEAITVLTRVKGIGPWSAEMFLIHQLKRPDVLPAGDLGIRRAIRHAFALDDTPTLDDVRRRGKAWAPNRTYAAALLWGSMRAWPE